MERLESVIGKLAMVLAASTAGVALMAAGSLVVKGPAAMRQAHVVPPAITATGNPAAEAAAQPVSDPAPQQAAAAAPVAAAPVAAVAPVALAAADATAPDPKAGEAVFKKCQSCHTADQSAANRVGPHLWGVVNRPTAHAEGFKYSKAMLSHDAEVWTPEHLDAYLAKPKDVIPGTSMSFAGLPKVTDRHNVIAFLAQQSDTPVAPEALIFAAATAPEAAPAADTAPADTAAVETAAPDVPEPEQIAHVDPAPPSDEEIAAIAQKIDALKADLPKLDYERARHHPIHYPPMIDTASNGECLVCHQEVMDHQVRETSPAGVKAIESLAWYQTLDTYVPQDGTGQSDFHWRHLQSPLAQDVMNLQCNFCHRGNDPREESPDMMPLRVAGTTPAVPEFTLRKMVNPSETCLLCHGAMPSPENIMGLGGPWHEVRADMEDQNDPDPTLANGCLSCHAELFRTNRHNVTYLKAASIEDLAQAGSDTCYGCHGGRAWYRISFPYPRQPWPGMDPEVPEWAKDRPTTVDPRYAMPAAQN